MIGGLAATLTLGLVGGLVGMLAPAAGAQTARASLDRLQEPAGRRR